MLHLHSNNDDGDAVSEIRKYFETDKSFLIKTYKSKRQTKSFIS
jgi:hypothetical protein